MCLLYFLIIFAMGRKMSTFRMLALFAAKGKGAALALDVKSWKPFSARTLVWFDDFSRKFVFSIAFSTIFRRYPGIHRESRNPS